MCFRAAVVYYRTILMIRSIFAIFLEEFILQKAWLIDEIAAFSALDQALGCIITMCWKLGGVREGGLWKATLPQTVP